MTFQEVIPLLSQGAKVRRATCPKEHYIQIKKSVHNITLCTGENEQNWVLQYLHLKCSDWEVLEEVKKYRILGFNKDEVDVITAALDNFIIDTVNSEEDIELARSLCNSFLCGGWITEDALNKSLYIRIFNKLCTEL